MFRSAHYYFAILFIITSLNPALANTANNTLLLTKGASSPAASIDDVSWIAGNWQGNIWGGQFEENWSKPTAGSMMASFKFTENNKVTFYELITISEYQDSLILRLKHFGPDLEGWEEKDQSMDFKLVKVSNEAVYFEGYTYKKVDQNTMHVFVVIDSEGKKQTTQFIFKRSSLGQ